jgi:hypothetical protein
MDKPGQGGSELHIQEKWRIASRNGGRRIICGKHSGVKDYTELDRASCWLFC